MRIQPHFDPIFDQADQRADDPARAERKAFTFDGWSYQPIAAPQEKQRQPA